MPITLLDGILLVFMLVSAVLAMIRGFSREVLSVFSWVAAAAAAYYFHEPLTPMVSGYISGFSDNETVPRIAAAAIVFLIALIIVSYITMRIADFIIDSRIGALDRTLGFVFGAVRGLLLVVVAYMFFSWLVAEDQPTWIANAKSRPLLESIGTTIRESMPDNPQETLDRLRNKETGAEADTSN